MPGAFYLMVRSIRECIAKCLKSYRQIRKKYLLEAADVFLSDTLETVSFEDRKSKNSEILYAI
jgi:hypothetical protein